MKMRSSKNETKTPAVKQTDASLSEELHAFASQLGFATPKDTGFNDSDFLPEKANRKLGSVQKRQSDGKPRVIAGDRQLSDRQISGKEAGPSNRQDGRAVHAKGGAKAGERKWNFGAGIRPGEKAGRSLMGRDESALWYEILDALERPNATSQPLDESQVEGLRNEAEVAIAREAEIFEQDLGRNRADSRWLQQVRQAGTTADKLAAMTLLLRESPVGNLKSLDELLKWVGKRSGARGAAAQAIDALKELFVTTLLPDRKLLSFEQQPLGSLRGGKERKKLLLLLYFEDAVKKRYAQFVRMLQEASRDNLEYIKDKAVRAITDLLRGKPEQEGLLLTALVDKLGDPSRKTAAHAGYQLGQLLEEHPVMSTVVVQEVERFVFRPHLPARAVYFAVIFLNQIVLSKHPEQGGGVLAKKLINTYFTLFHLILEGKAGRAAEIQAERQSTAEKQRDKAGKRSKKARHDPKRQPAPKAGSTASAPLGAAAGEVDAKLLGGLLAGVRRAFPFVDPGDADALVERHSDALFRVMHTATFGVAVQALSLLFQLLDARSAISDRYYRALYGMLLAPDVARSNKSAMFLSLVFKAMKADVSEKRILAFIKRLLQVAIEQLPNFACGCLLLTSELIKSRPALWSPILEAVEEEVERFEDPPDDEEAASRADAARETAAAAGRAGEGEYDMSKREPLYCRAERTCLWELVPFAAHVHPSVAAMAKTLLAGMPIEYLGDPMRDLSISAFLDKFMLKKPKAQEKAPSVMQPRARVSATDVATPAFAEATAAQEAPDTAYFHKFYQVKAERERRGLRPKARNKRRGVEDGPLESDGEEDSLAGSDADSDEMDDAIDGDEDMEDVGYEELAAAMEADDSETSSGDGCNSASGEDGSSDEDDVGDGALVSGSDSEGRDQGSEEEIPEELDAFELASTSEGESQSASDEDPGDDDSDSEWIMAQGAEHLRLEASRSGKRKAGSGLVSEGDDSPVELRAQKKTPVEREVTAQRAGRKKQRKDVFASASDYAHLLGEEEGEQSQREKPRRRVEGKKASKHSA